MKIFVSYSRSVKTEVGKVIDLLRAIDHEVWWDGDIPIMADWWATILNKIEWCDVFIFVVSEKSAQSAYCLAELNYATERNRPILPFVIDDPSKYTIPAEVTPMRAQWYVYNGDPADMISRLKVGMANIHWNKHHDIYAQRPPEPNTNATSIIKLFQDAQKLAYAGKFEEAKRAFRNVKSLDYGEWGVECDEWVERMNRYAEIYELASDRATVKRAISKWNDFKARFGADFDPFDLVNNPPVIPSPTPPPMPIPTPKPVYTPPPKPIQKPLKNDFIPLPNAVGTSQNRSMLVIGGALATVFILIVVLVGILNNQQNGLSVAGDSTPTDTVELTATFTLEPTDFPTNTDLPTATNTDLPTATNTDLPTATNTDLPTATNTTQPTVTNTDLPTPTNTTQPIATISPEIGFTPITRNADWIPVEQDFDGVKMVLVPAGCFMMGSDTGLDDEQPVHEQCFDTPFWIDKYEVTQAQFAQFGGEKANPNNWSGDDLPVENITWFEARDFCALRGGRLPTEREWEYVARGPSNWVYPWGNDFVAENVVYSGNSGDRTAPVGSRPNGASWVGALDMAGNVYEWTSSLHQDYPYDQNDESVNDNTSRRVLRGGSWLYVDNLVRSANRDSFIPTGRVSNVGFRCLRSQE